MGDDLRAALETLAETLLPVYHPELLAPCLHDVNPSPQRRALPTAEERAQQKAATADYVAHLLEGFPQCRLLHTFDTSGKVEGLFEAQGLMRRMINHLFTGPYRKALVTGFADDLHAAAPVSQKMSDRVFNGLGTVVAGIAERWATGEYRPETFTKTKHGAKYEATLRAYLDGLRNVDKYRTENRQPRDPSVARLDTFAWNLVADIVYASPKFPYPSSN